MAIPDLHLVGTASNTPSECEAATRHVLGRFDRGELDGAAAREVLEMLGLVDADG